MGALFSSAPLFVLIAQNNRHPRTRDKGNDPINSFRNTSASSTTQATRIYCSIAADENHGELSVYSNEAAQTRAFRALPGKETSRYARASKRAGLWVLEHLTTPERRISQALHPTLTIPKLSGRRVLRYNGCDKVFINHARYFLSFL